MPLGLILGIGRTGRKVPHRSIFYPRNEPLEITYYEGKNCKSTGFHTRKGRYVVMQEKLPNYVVPDLTDFKLKPCISVPERYQNCGGC